MVRGQKFTEDEDSELRADAFDWLDRRTGGGRDALRWDDIEDYRFRDEIALRNRYKGIWKPAQLNAALSFTTAYRPPGAKRPYEDTIGPDKLVRYKWQGDDPGSADNVAMRAALQTAKPLIWFFGVGSGVYQPIFPVYLVDEEPTQQQFIVVTDEVHDVAIAPTASESIVRSYIERATLTRVHQPVFRSMVMRAYNTRCAVCALGHSQLLDAAHIVPDGHDLGIASVTNGLALCKIHHGAFDAKILGVDPDLTVHIRPDLLLEVDGPMLRHGLQERDQQRLMSIPTLKSERPSRELLDIAYQKFLAG